MTLHILSVFCELVIGATEILGFFVSFQKIRAGCIPDCQSGGRNTIPRYKPPKY